MRTLEDVLKRLNDYKADAEARLEAWKKVEIVTKKDGSEFKVFSKNFKDARIGAYYPVEDGLHPYLTVNYRVNGRYESTQFEIFYYVDELPKDDERRKNYKSSFLRQTITMTIPEIKARLEKEIEHTESTIIDYENQIKNAEKAYNEYAKAMKEAEEKLIANCEFTTVYKNSLYYAVKECFK